MSARDLRPIWNQANIPVVYRPKPQGGRPSSGRLCARLPYRDGNKEWLRDDRRTKPEWNPKGKYWSLPRSWFDDFVKKCIVRFGRVYVIQPFREQEKCAPACWGARGFECACSCMGANHGQDSGEGWRVINETFAVRWEDRQLACRLISKAPD